MIKACFIACLLLGSAGHATVLDARQWWNLRSLHAPDERAYVLLLFSTRDDAKVKPLLGRLHHLDKRPDVLVVGLSPDSTQRVKPFIDKHKIKFLVGGSSRACLRLGGSRLPRLLLLQANQDAPSPRARPSFPGTLDGLKELESLLKVNAGQKTQGAAVPNTDSLNENTPVAQLRATALTGSRGARRRALKLLRSKLAPEPFMELCDELLMAPPPPKAAEYYMRSAQWYGHVAYLRHLADPEVKEKQPFLSPGGGARQNIDPVDVPLLEIYKGALAEKSAGELADAYLKRLSDGPLDMVVREEIIHSLNAQNDQRQALNALILLAPEEPDTFLRWCLVSTIGYVCDRDDSDHSDVIAFLEDMLETETDIRRVRPTIVAILEHLYVSEK